MVIHLNLMYIPGPYHYGKELWMSMDNPGIVCDITGHVILGRHAHFSPLICSPPIPLFLSGFLFPLPILSSSTLCTHYHCELDLQSLQITLRDYWLRTPLFTFSFLPAYTERCLLWSDAVLPDSCIHASRQRWKAKDRHSSSSHSEGKTWFSSE